MLTTNINTIKRMKETLFLIKQIDGIFLLKDFYNHPIGRFKTENEAVKWCKENGYRLRKDGGGLLC